MIFHFIRKHGHCTSLAWLAKLKKLCIIWMRSIDFLRENPFPFSLFIRDIVYNETKCARDYQFVLLEAYFPSHSRLTAGRWCDWSAYLRLPFFAVISFSRFQSTITNIRQPRKFIIPYIEKKTPEYENETTAKTKIWKTMKIRQFTIYIV